MASVCSDPKIVSVSCGTKTVIVQLCDGAINSFAHSDINGKNIISEEKDDSQTNKASCESEEIGLGLVCCDISSNGKLLAFCTLAKLLCIVDLKESNPTVVKVYNLARGASRVRFTTTNNQVLVADKSGDVYLFKPQTEDDSGQLILGHLSLLLDVLITPDERFIITCDRDEKIRVSSYPNGYNIVAYCLGHTEFVSSLRLLPHNQKYLISTSGDGTIRFWNYIVGVEKTVCNASQSFNQENKLSLEGSNEGNIAAITDASTTFLDSSTSLICVTIDNFSACLVFKCLSENDNLYCGLIQNISLENCHPWGLSLDSKHLWLVLSCNDSLLVQTKVFNLDECKFGDNVSSGIANVVEKINNQKLTVDQKQNIVSLLFKRKFENVQDYLRRKELRLSGTEPLTKKVKA